MATYNGGAFISRQLNSFSMQERRPDELIVCDDGSTDDTREQIEAFAARAGFHVRLVRNEQRLGYNRNFAKAIGLCSGDLIFISDQDDEWYPGKLKAVASAFAADPRLAAVTNDQDIVDRDGLPAGRTVLQNVRALGYPDTWFGPGCCTAFRRSFLPIFEPFPEQVVPYDHWVNLLPDLLGARLVLEQPLQSYRRHGANTSGSIFATPEPKPHQLASRTDRAETRAAYLDKVGSAEIMLRRLADRRSEIDALGLSDRFGTAVRMLEQERDGYAARLACLEQPRFKRPLLVAAALRSGHYKQFRGLKSALKDLIA